MMLMANDTLDNLIVEAEKGFSRTMDVLLEHLNSSGIHLPSEELTLVDVGSEDMFYRNALEMWLLKRAKIIKILAVDPFYLEQPSMTFAPSVPSRVTIERVPSPIEYAAHILKEKGISHVDIFTLFNPNTFRSMPRISELGELAKNVPVVGSISDGILANMNRFHDELSGQGYDVTSFRNPYSRAFDMGKVWGHDYDVLFVALPK